MAFDMIVELTIGVIIIIYLLFKYLTWDYSYWKNRNVPYIKPKFPYGSIEGLVTNKEQLGIFYKNLCVQMRGEKYFGILELGTPALVLQDPNLIKSILVTDFQYFADRGHVHEKIKKDFLNSKQLFSLKGSAWRKMRAKITPVFTSGRMKQFFELLIACSVRLDSYLHRAAENNEVIEFKDLIVRFTSDSISSTLFGLETNAIFEKDSEVRRIGSLIMSQNKWNMIKFMMAVTYPALYEFFNMRLFDAEVTRFCMQVAQDTYNFRIKNNIYRNDFIDLLIKIKHNKNLLEDEKNTNVGPRNSDGNDDGEYLKTVQK